nr:MAG TPA: hypothetical protein [Bacteriophage sp.]
MCHRLSRPRIFLHFVLQQKYLLRHMPMEGYSHLTH